MAQVLTANHRTNRLLAALEAKDFELLVPYLELVNLSVRQVLYNPGDVIRHVYFPHDAMISLVNVMEDGNTVEIAIFGREGVSGLLSALATREAFGQYIVQMAGTASRISYNHLDEARNARTSLKRLLNNYGEALLAQTFQTLACNTIHTVEARCCRWILSMHDRADGDTLPLTHEFLAAMLGVQRSTVSAVTRTLQTAGLIRQCHGRITITDRAGLEEATCECYGKIRRVYQRLLPGTYPQARSR